MHRHFILHKPAGVISQFVYTHKRKKVLLGDLFPFPEGTMAIGRLDVHSEGLLLLTTDGKVSEAIRSNKIEKEYHVLVDGIVSTAAIKALEEGVVIGFDGKKYRTKPCRATIISSASAILDPTYKKRDPRHGPTSWLSIVVTEGKFRQIRKMTAVVGLPTLRLVRVRVGSIHLEDLPVGMVIELPSFS